jgi:CelD/BcsL family acetyltransferase involved in cellulose biosynthesis/biotin carboxylase
VAPFSIAIVDPYDAGSMLAPAFAEHGVASVMVASTSSVPQEHRASFDPAAYRRLLFANDDLAAIIEALRDIEVRHVIPGSERGVNLADRLAGALGLPGNGTDLSPARRNKFLMIQRASDCGVRVPRQFRSDDVSAMREWIEADGLWPAIVKPCEAIGSEGVRLCASHAELTLAFHSILGRTNCLDVFNDTVLAQEYLRGNEYVIDTVSRDGVHRLAGLWAYRKPAAGFETVGRLASKDLLTAEGPLADQLFAFAVDVLNALEIRNGPAHCELIIDDKGPALVEIGARLHGGPPAHLMSREAIGDSQLDQMVRSIVAPKAFLEQAGQRYRLTRRAAMFLLRDRKLAGTIEGLPSARRIVWNAKEGEPLPPVAGLATLIHSDARVIEADIEIAAGRLSCELLQTRDAVESIAPAWRGLLEQARSNRAFASPSWYLAALEVQPWLAPRVLVSFRGETLAGVIPLVWDHRADVVCFATALSDYNDLIVARGDVAPARLLMSVARARFRNLELACVRADSDCAQAEARVAAFGERKVVCPYAEISSGYEAWLSSRSITFRKNLKRAIRRASSHRIEVGRLDPSQHKSLDLASRFLQLHKDRFGERSLFVRDPVARAFVARALPELLRDGSAALFGFWANEQLAGVNVCMVGVDSLCYWNAGFLSSAEAISPGTLMIHAGLREACAMGLREFDMMRGAEAYKMRWCGCVREIGRLL